MNLARQLLHSGGLTVFLGRLKIIGFLSVKKVKTHFLAKWIWRLKISPSLPRVKTEEWRSAKNVKIKCEDCILKCEDPKINCGWLDPPFWNRNAGYCKVGYLLKVKTNQHPQQRTTCNVNIGRMHEASCWCRTNGRFQFFSLGPRTLGLWWFFLMLIHKVKFRRPVGPNNKP